MVPLPIGLEKPPPVDVYDGTSDPGDHIENIEAVLYYRGVRGAVKCTLFPTTLKKGAMNCYKSLPPGSIDSSRGHCHQFTAHFTASRRQPKTEATLEAIVQGNFSINFSIISHFSRS
ncbi:hypothetical protein A2U01_0003841 [Trifolium medium]|uniref:Uncharacterized protein n=1 Tax=Trifolium medium TaxID=97028 RepID=A0A392M6F5_9FABA|nr:hypothetical protein [Trifolium medium]